MSFKELFGGLFLILIIIITSTVLVDIYYKSDPIFNNFVINELTVMSESRGKVIDEYIVDKEDEVLFLTRSNRVKEILKGELSNDYNLTHEFLEFEIKIIKNAIENYLILNKEMSLEQLQNNWEFKKISIVKFGNESYTRVYDSEFEKILIANNKNHQDILISEALKKNNLEVIYENLSNKDNVLSGNILIEEGEKKLYYDINMQKINYQTSDKVNLTIGLDLGENIIKINKNISKFNLEYLDRYKKTMDIGNIILISKQGNIIYSNNNTVGFGQNLNWYSNSNLGKDVAYREYISQEDVKINYYGPFYENFNGVKRLHSIILAPVYDGDIFIGSIGLIFNLDNFINNLEEIEHLTYLGENYVVSETGKLITKLKFQNVTLLTQDITGLDLNKCLFENDTDDKLENLVTKNYFGENVYRKLYRVDKFNWCLVSEVSKEEIFEIPKNKKINSKLFLFSGALVFVFIGVVLSLFLLDMKYLIVKKKRSEFIREEFDFINKYRKLTFRTRFILAILVPVIFVIIVEILVFKFKENAIYHIFPNLSILIFTLMILFFSVEFKKMESRKYMIIGSLLVIISKSLSIIYQELIISGVTILRIYWDLNFVLLVFGILGIFYGYRRELK